MFPHVSEGGLHRALLGCASLDAAVEQLLEA